MLRRICVLLLVVWVCSSSGVVQLSDKDYKDTLESGKTILLQFYAPWCGHCKNLAPEYEKLPSLLQSDGVIVAKINADAEKQAAKFYPIKGFPTVILIHRGVKLNYMGERKAESISEWVKAILNTKLQSITVSQIEEKRATENLVVVRSKDEVLLQKVTIVNAFGETRCYHLEQEGNKITIYSKVRGESEYSGELDVESIIGWITLKTTPIFLPLADQKYMDRFGAQKNTLLLILLNELSEETLKTLQKYCEDSQKQIVCAVVKKQEKIMSNILAHLKIDNTSEASRLVYLTDHFETAYLAEFTAHQLYKQKIDQWIANIKAGQVDPTVKKPGPVKYEGLIDLSQENFTQYINDHPYTFVQFYWETESISMAMAEDFQKFAQQYNAQQQKVKVVVVNGGIRHNLTDWERIIGAPVYRMYYEGQYLEYNASKNGFQTPALKKFIQSVLTSELKTISDLSQINKPALVVYDQAEQSHLNSLTVRNPQLAVYQLKQGENIKIEYHGKEIQVYPGDVKNISQIMEWIDVVKRPVLIDIGVRSRDDQRLSLAFEKQIPILMIVFNQEQGQQKYTQELTNLCKGKHKQYACGTLKKGQQIYSDIVGWLQVQQPQTNYFVYIQTWTSSKFLFDKPISELSADSIKDFIERVQSDQVLKIQSKKANEDTKSAQNNQQKSNEKSEESQESKEQSEKKEEERQSEEQKVNDGEL